MNRKIAFRAFHKPTKRYFDVDHFDNHEVYPVTPEGQTDFEFKKWIDGSFERDDCVLTQHTGLLDKKGKSIWEADILRDDIYHDADEQAKGNRDYSTYFQVRYEKGSFVLASLCEGYADTAPVSDWALRNGVVDMTRVSNPFEHPELLDLTNQEYPVAAPSPYNTSGGPQHVEPVVVSKVVPLHPNGLDFRVYHKPSKNFYVGITLTHEGIQVTNEEEETLPDLSYDDCILLPFTGATDHTGRKIYEGDIYMDLAIDLTNDVIDAAFIKVAINRGCAYGFLTGQSGEFFPFCEEGMYPSGADYSYLGNRFENPGLLEIKQYETPSVFHAIMDVMCDYNLPVMTQLHPYGPEQLKRYAIAIKKGHNQFTTTGQQVA